MKLLIAIVKPFKVAPVMDALDAVGIRRLSVSEIKGFGRQRGHSEIYKGTEYQVDFVPKARLEIALDDDEVDRAVAAIRNAANTDTIGDGKIFILDLIEAIRIRTGERGADAL
jgi:nitrogen regulatory protein PII